MDAFKLVRIVHCAMHMHWDEVTQALCNAYSPVHIAHSLAPNVQCVCVVGCNSVHWAHCTVYIRQYPLCSVDYRMRVRSEMGSHQFRGSSPDPRLLKSSPNSPIVLWFAWSVAKVTHGLSEMADLEPMLTADITTQGYHWTAFKSRQRYQAYFLSW